MLGALVWNVGGARATHARNVLYAFNAPQFLVAFMFKKRNVVVILHAPLHLSGYTYLRQVVPHRYVLARLTVGFCGIFVGLRVPETMREYVPSPLRRD